MRPGHQPTLAQTLAALYYVVSFGFGLYAWILCAWLCAKLPLLFGPVLATYLAFIYTMGATAPCSGDWPTPLRRWRLWSALAAYFPARLHATAELAPERGPFIFCCHPHGILAFTTVLCAGSLGTRFPGLDCRLLTLNINFMTPLFREYLLLQGMCDVSMSSLLCLLRRGKSIVIAVGGGTESLYAKPGAHDLVLSRRRGFIKAALRTGASLVPVYCFGENSTFRTVNELPPSSRLRHFQRALTRLTGFTIPLYFGRGFLLPWGFIPFPVPLDVVVGEPLPVDKWKGGEASGAFEAEVDRQHARYVASLRQLFEAHRDTFAQGEADLQLVE